MPAQSTDHLNLAHHGPRYDIALGMNASSSQPQKNYDRLIDARHVVSLKFSDPLP
jgi:hypothetical protein